MTDDWGISCKIALRWMPLDLADNKSTLVQVMAWCRQATSHYLSQCWPRFMSPYGVIRPQWVTGIDFRIKASSNAPRDVCLQVLIDTCHLENLIYKKTPHTPSARTDSETHGRPSLMWNRLVKVTNFGAASKWRVVAAFVIKCLHIWLLYEFYFHQE